MIVENDRKCANEMVIDDCPILKINVKLMYSGRKLF